MPLAPSLVDSPSRLTRTRGAVRPGSQPFVVYTIDTHSVSGQRFGRETFARRDDAESFLEDIRLSDPAIARDLRIEERELVAG